MFALWNTLSDGVINFIFIYKMRIEWIIGFISIIGVTSVVGNLLTPVLIKKFEKRTCILFMRSVWIAVTACYLIALRLESIPLLLLLIFIRSAIFQRRKKKAERTEKIKNEDAFGGLCV